MALRILPETDPLYDTSPAAMAARLRDRAAALRRNGDPRCLALEAEAERLEAEAAKTFSERLWTDAVIWTRAAFPLKRVH